MYIIIIIIIKLAQAIYMHRVRVCMYVRVRERVWLSDGACIHRCVHMGVCVCLFVSLFVCFALI